MTPEASAESEWRAEGQRIQRRINAVREDLDMLERQRERHQSNKESFIFFRVQLERARHV